MKIRFFGTGAGLPSKERNTSSLSIELLNEIGEEWLFDCGEGTQRQMLESNIKPTNIGKIFITHNHGDHIYGLPGLLSTISNMGRKEAMDIFAPKGLKEWLLGSLKITGTYLGYKLNFYELTDNYVYDFDKFKVEVTTLNHDVICYGFKVIQKDLEGVLDVDKAKMLGVPFGPLMGNLKNGKDVLLENGQLIKSSEVLGTKRKGKVIVICGDTAYYEKLETFSKGADILVHEATIFSGKDESRKISGHSTNVEASTVAKKAEVGVLILNHISSRYFFNDLVDMELESRKIFNKTFIAKDLEEYDVNLGWVLRK